MNPLVSFDDVGNWVITLNGMFVKDPGSVITSIIKCGMKLPIQSQTSTMQPLKFVNGKVISPRFYWAWGYWKLIQCTKVSTQENLFEYVVCSMSAILLRPQCVNVLSGCDGSDCLWQRWVICRDHSGYGLIQWESTLHCNVVSHWLCPYLE